MRTTLIAPLLFAGALAALCGTFYEAYALVGVSADRANAAQTAAQQLDRSSYNKRLHATVSDTVSSRAVLENFVHADIVSMAKAIESAGKETGANVSVTDAAPEDSSVQLWGGGSLRAIAFSVVADGSYASLMRAEAAFEKLPFPAQVVQFDIENAEVQGKDTWHLIVKIRALVITDPV